MSAFRLLALKGLVATAAVAPLAALAPSGIEHYVGRTSQGTAIKLQVAAERSMIAVLEIGYRDHCSNGRSYRASTRIRGVALNGQRFATHGVYLAGMTEDHYTVTGKVGRRSAHGYFALRANGTDSAGRNVHCKTGRIGWTARRRRRR